MASVEAVNLGLRLALELCTLAALSYLGIVTGGDPLVSVVLGLGFPALAATVWGRFVAPRAKRRLDDPARLAVEVLFFASGVAALVLSGVPLLAAVLAAAVVLHFGLMLVFRLR